MVAERGQHRRECDQRPAARRERLAEREAERRNEQRVERVVGPDQIRQVRRETGGDRAPGRRRLRERQRRVDQDRVGQRGQHGVHAASRVKLERLGVREQRHQQRPPEPTLPAQRRVLREARAGEHQRDDEQKRRHARADLQHRRVADREAGPAHQRHHQHVRKAGRAVNRRLAAIPAQAVAVDQVVRVAQEHVRVVEVGRRRVEQGPEPLGGDYAGSSGSRRVATKRRSPQPSTDSTSNGPLRFADDVRGRAVRAAGSPRPCCTSRSSVPARGRRTWSRPPETGTRARCRRNVPGTRRRRRRAPRAL